MFRLIEVTTIGVFSEMSISPTLLVSGNTTFSVTTAWITNSSNASQGCPSDSRFYPSEVTTSSAKVNFYVYLAIIAVALGLVGNIAALIVTVCSPFYRHSTLPVYVQALAVFDTIVVLTKLRILWQSFDPSFYCIFFTNTAVCQFYHVFLFGSRLSAVWIIVALTLERCIVVRQPFMSARITKRTVYIVVVIITSLSFASQFYNYLISYDEESGHCVIREKGDFVLHHTLSFVVTLFLLCFMLPCIVIVVCNLIIIRTVKVRNRNQQFFSTVPVTPKKGASRDNDVARICLVLSISFVLLTGLEGFCSLAFYLSLTKVISNSLFNGTYLYPTANFLTLINHCANFYLYTITGKTFRARLKRVLYYKCLAKLCRLDVDQKQYAPKIYGTPNPIRRHTVKKRGEMRAASASYASHIRERRNNSTAYSSWEDSNRSTASSISEGHHNPTSSSISEGHHNPTSSSISEGHHNPTHFETRAERTNVSDIAPSEESFNLDILVLDNPVFTTETSNS